MVFILHRAYRCFLVLAFLSLVMWAPQARAQNNFSRLEFGAQAGAIGLLNADTSVGIWPGFGVRFDFNMTRRLALETQVDLFPVAAPVRFLEQGGTTLQLAAGLRGKVVQTKRYSVFGVIRPGFLRFADTSQLTGAPGSTPGSKNGAAIYYALNLGGGVEFYPSSRWVIRFEASGNPYLVPNARPAMAPVPPAPPVPTPGIVDDRYRFSLGLAYRAGTLRENGPEKTISGKFEFGSQFTTLILRRRTTLDAIRNEPGFGGFVSYRLMRFLYADSSLQFYPRGSKNIGFQDGGRMFQGLFGFKAGITRDRISIFGKARPGLMVSTDTITGFSTLPATNGQPLTGPFSMFVLDLGGIVEIRATRRTFVRFDVGDTHLYFPDRFITQTNGTVTRIPGGSYQHSMQYSAGYGWRF
jgi:hypothetical protein